MQRLLRVLLVALLVCVGCGGGGVDSKSSTPTTARDGDPRSKTELAADREVAEAALLKAADFPADWTTEPSNDDAADSPDSSADFADCLQVDRALLVDEKVRAESTFAHAGLQVLSSVGMQPTRAAAEKEVAVYAKPEYPHCLKSEMGAPGNRKPGAQSPAGVEMGDITITELELGPFGEDSRAFRAEIAVTAPGRSGSIFVDLAFIRVGRATGILNFRSFGVPFDEKTEAALATTFVSRLPKH